MFVAKKERRDLITCWVKLINTVSRLNPDCNNAFVTVWYMLTDGIVNTNVTNSAVTASLTEQRIQYYIFCHN